MRILEAFDTLVPSTMTAAGAITVLAALRAGVSAADLAFRAATAAAIDAAGIAMVTEEIAADGSVGAIVVRQACPSSWLDRLREGFRFVRHRYRGAVLRQRTSQWTGAEQRRSGRSEQHPEHRPARRSFCQLFRDGVELPPIHVVPSRLPDLGHPGNTPVRHCRRPAPKSGGRTGTHRQSPTARGNPGTIRSFSSLLGQ